MSFYLEYFDSVAEEIISSERFKSLKNYIIHNGTSVYDHSLEVARRAYMFVLRNDIKCDLRSLIRGALLHDYYLYDCRIKKRSNRLHEFKHAKIALKNACRDFELNKKEKNIIKSHMFPLNIFTWPASKEAWIITIIDKKVATLEMMKKRSVLA